MIRFQEKQYSNLRTSTARGAGLGAAIAVGINKLMKTAVPDIVKKTAARTKEGKLKFDDKTGKQIFNTEVLKEGSEVFKEGMQKVAPKLNGLIDKFDEKVTSKVITLFENDKVSFNSSKEFLYKFGKICDWLKGANKSFWDNLTRLGSWIMSNPGKAGIAGAAIGASLAVGYYLIKASYNKANQKLVSVKGKMIEKVAKTLVKMGYKRDVDFTTDPSQADYLKTKVCIVVSSTKDEVALSINSINEPKLEPVSRAIIKNLPSGTKFYKRESGSNNELTLAMTGSNNGDPTYIASIAERFIRKKYPVFLIEIN